MFLYLLISRFIMTLHELGVRNCGIQCVELIGAARELMANMFNVHAAPLIRVFLLKSKSHHDQGLIPLRDPL